MNVTSLSSLPEDEVGLPPLTPYSSFYLNHQRSLESAKRVTLVALGILFSSAYTQNFYGFKDTLKRITTPLISIFDFSTPGDAKANLIKQAFYQGWGYFQINFFWYLFKYIIKACRLPTEYRLLGNKILQHPSLSPKEKALALQRYYAFLHALQDRKLADPLSSKELLFLKLVAAFPRDCYASVEKKDPKTYLKTLHQLWETHVTGQEPLKRFFINNLYREYLQIGSSWTRNLAFQGPTGVGKTHLVMNFLQKATQRPVIKLPLTSITSLKELIGSSSEPGMLIRQLIKCKVANPIFFFDELDKQKDPAILEFFTQLCDPLHHREYRDKFLKDFAIDLSKASFIFAFNKPSSLPLALLDRCKRLYFQALEPIHKVNITLKTFSSQLEKYSSKELQAARAFLLKQAPSLSLRQLSLVFEDYLFEKDLAVSALIK